MRNCMAFIFKTSICPRICAINNQWNSTFYEQISQNRSAHLRYNLISLWTQLFDAMRCSKTCLSLSCANFIWFQFIFHLHRSDIIGTLELDFCSRQNWFWSSICMSLLPKCRQYLCSHLVCVYLSWNSIANTYFPSFAYMHINYCSLKVSLVAGTFLMFLFFKFFAKALPS